MGLRSRATRCTESVKRDEDEPVLGSEALA